MVLSVATEISNQKPQKVEKMETNVNLTKVLKICFIVSKFIKIKKIIKNKSI